MWMDIQFNNWGEPGRPGMQDLKVRGDVISLQSDWEAGSATMDIKPATGVLNGHGIGTLPDGSKVRLEYTGTCDRWPYTGPPEG